MVSLSHASLVKLGSASTNSKTSLERANPVLKLNHVTDQTAQLLSKATGDQTQQVWIT